MQSRNVNVSLFLKLLKGWRPFGILGLVFTCLALFVLLPITIVISTSINEPYQNYNAEDIVKNGIEKQAVITDIKTISNVSVNNANPVELTYNYDLAGKNITDKFMTIDLDKVNRMNIGDTVPIKAYNNESVITILEPFSFPIYLFLLLPGGFLLIGSIFLLIGLVPALKNFRLYKYGVLREATLVATSPYTYSMSYRNVQQVIKLEYSFKGRNGETIYGNSITNDFLMFNEKKLGDTIKIFVDANDESKNVIAPRVEALKYNWNI